MSNQKEVYETLQRREAEYYDVLKVLEHRARKSRIYIFILIYSMLLVATLVMIGAYYIKTNQSPISTLTSSLLSFSEKAKTEAAIKEFNATYGDILKSTNTTTAQEPKQNGNSGLFYSASIVNSLLSSNSQPEKIASSIASVVLSFSVILFVGFVMKSILIFIRYYMQLGTDFDNQKIAFILSKGEQQQFQKYLSSLRDHNISFEKTPSLPQEKIITGLIEALANNKNNSK
ncbi:hypothetical protein DMT87_18195 [Salmonella enterica]|uniref:Uncharacterized protein n=3 Tax=Salmonella enterica TaxID=28901 RepID=A0A702LHC5_SALER|nr:hypothetical protein [Salmonella enterica]EBW2465771.1 hypothetical protein [Salmonella enterica subsp. enterica serovar Elisabethville]EBX2304286.1 hypothetical protein [Salmonella enterica subsp. enterica serovar Chester]ECF6833334.1 hypothetical protein [Salmonella enterica subsp. enterica]ECY3517214.1 hypothetical protein [Salmonella enterica subsp. enterica serovar Sekondi]ECY3651752.1 hypothetical protein [Salmonella enterica subsp. enterica serovar Panama]EGI6282344.1 hypothetical p